jgi:outer membrane protein OmpA-like peptidoglycan-associated protein
MFTAFRVGLLIFFALVILSIGVFLIGNQSLMFSPTYVLKSNFQNVQGLSNGAEVRIGGIHEGTVKQIQLPAQPGGQMTVVMNLRNPTRSVIKKDSVASIKTEGILGDKYVEVSFGSSKSETVSDGDTISSEKPSDVSEQAKAVTDQAKAAAGKFRDDMEALQHNFLLRGYFEKRGYHDAAELKRNAIDRLPAERPTKEFGYDAREIFDKPNNAKLKNKKKLGEAGKYLEGNNFGLVVIASFETTGDTHEAQTLTKARAKVVRDYLVQNFKLDDTRIKTIGLGKKHNTEASPKIAILVYPARLQARADFPFLRAIGRNSAPKKENGSGVEPPKPFVVNYEMVAEGQI